MKRLRSGDIGASIGNLWGSGILGYIWSSQAGSSFANQAYFLVFNATDVKPSVNDNVRWYGFPLRCLARQ